MAASLTGALRRELALGKTNYVVTISPEGLKRVLKGHRKGYELDWHSPVGGDAALATAVNACLFAPLQPTKKPPAQAAFARVRIQSRALKVRRPGTRRYRLVCAKW